MCYLIYPKQLKVEVKVLVALCDPVDCSQKPEGQIIFINKEI